MSRFIIDVTDTFGGEANYSWRKRYTCNAKSIRGAINWLARHHGGYWRIDWTDGETARYNMRDANICAFIEYDGE